MQSFHPPALKRGIPKGQFLRAKRNCSNFPSFKKESDTLRKRFRDRGYPTTVLNKAYQQASVQDRTELLSKNKSKESEDCTRIIGTFDIAATEVRNILEMFWLILKRDPFIANCVSECPSLTFWRGRNVGDFLIPSHYAPPKEGGTWLQRGAKGTFRCGTCKPCKYIWNTKTFVHPTTGITYFSSFL